MKKIALLVTTFCLSTVLAFANDTELNYDEKKINAEFEQLNKIEAYVQKNEGTTLEALKTENPNLVDGISLKEESAVTIKDASDLFGIPAFLWGCVLGVVGLLLVYIFTDNDKAQVKKAVMGCLVGSVVGVVIYIVAIAGAAASTL
jgi:hypothetical protein